jgi:hypothetical protein
MWSYYESESKSESDCTEKSESNSESDYTMKVEENVNVKVIVQWQWK